MQVLLKFLPEPLSPERQWYLFDHTRSLWSDKSKHDEVAPKPKSRNKTLQQDRRHEIGYKTMFSFVQIIQF